MNPASVFSTKLLTAAIKRNATDIHLCPEIMNTSIYFRINGQRSFYCSITNNHYDIYLTHFKFNAGMDIGESRKPQNGSLTINLKEENYSLRLSTLPLKEMESLAIRILPQNNLQDIKHLFLFPQQLTTIRSWITHRSGIILFTGPTGSGKTTTLYALLQSLLIDQSFQAITLEDPIEKSLNNILQVQVNEKSGLSYNAGLKAALRHDPDILMVGEIRDRETAKFAFHASYTGHLVLSTLHANNALGTIHRLLEMGIQRIDLIQTLIAVASIQLVPIETPNGKRRAAILELLDTNLLIDAIENPHPSSIGKMITFSHLRKKAFAYGFTNSSIFNEEKTEINY